MRQLYLEDLSVGLRVTSRSVTLSAREIINFARENDPQFFHVDENEATNSVFGGLVASGWQTAALAVKLLLGSFDAPFAGGVVGADTHVTWRQPVRPGDSLRIDATITGIKRPRTRPDRGFVAWKMDVLNQRDEIVQSQKLTFVVFRNPACL